VLVRAGCQKCQSCCVSTSYAISRSPIVDARGGGGARPRSAPAPVDRGATKSGDVGGATLWPLASTAAATSRRLKDAPLLSWSTSRSPVRFESVV
jgi:hypothetical protein